MESLQEVTNALSNGAIPEPLRPPVAQDLGNRNQKQQSRLSQEQVKLYGLQIWREHLQGPLKILEKRERGRIHGLHNFFGSPIFSGMVKGTKFTTNVKFCTHIHRIDRKKSPLKFREKSSRGRTEGLPKIFRAAIYRAHRAVTFAVAQLSCYYMEGVGDNLQRLRPIRSWGDYPGVSKVGLGHHHHHHHYQLQLQQGLSRVTQLEAYSSCYEYSLQVGLCHPSNLIIEYSVITLASTRVLAWDI